MGTICFAIVGTRSCLGRDGDYVGGEGDSLCLLVTAPIHSSNDGIEHSNHEFNLDADI